MTLEKSMLVAAEK